MTSHIPLATLLLAGALPLAGIADDQNGGMPAAAASPPDIDRSAADAGPAGAMSGTPGTVGSIGPGAVPPLFNELDQDKDGQISRDEAKRSADTTARFDEIDADRDGKLSAAEWIMAEEKKSH